MINIGFNFNIRRAPLYNFFILRIKLNLMKEKKKDNKGADKQAGKGKEL